MKRHGSILGCMLGLALASVALAGCRGRAVAPVEMAPSVAVATASPVPAAMGGTAAGWIDDLSALYLDPAGLAGRRFEGSVVTAVASGAPYPAPAEQLDALRRLASTPDAPIAEARARVTTLGGLLIDGSGLALMALGEADVRDGSQEARLLSAFSFGAGYPIGPRWLSARWQAGTALRLLQAQEARPDQGTSRVGRGFAVDAALRASWAETLSVGLVLHDLAGSITWRDQDGAPAGARQWLLSGSRARVGVVIVSPDRRTRLTGEAGLDGAWGIGLEQRVLGDRVAARVGKGHLVGLGPSDTMGVGLRLGPLAVDAALVLPQGDEAPSLVAALRVTF
ncbi:hypothetical protein [Geochorda subterranea]|uniref:Uncharacterized protein n=1 Tax=Geochorda subterranea TaxID=3109564 RepID=A0ABZ1BN37_9FIRM|nr:hypothetical protein [Limnochorda sp. LNt]WRP14018.1 hypothetical protein VLY81_11380 [Limnochorda sp. LNt]